MQQVLRRRLSPTVLIFATALMVTAWAFAASTASAALPGYERVVASSERNSFNKGAVARCPAGLNVIGAGGEVAAGFGEVVIEDVIPDPNLKTVTVNAREQQGGSSREWRATAFAICAKPVPGLRLVSTDSADSSANKSITARCPVGLTVLGTGAELTTFGGTGQVKLDQINPSATSVFAFAREDRDGFAGQWSVTSHAICALPVGQRIVRQTTIPFSSSTSGSAVALCPDGQRTLGGGFDSTVLGSGREAVVESFFLGTGSVAASSRPDQFGVQLLRIMEAVAICA